MATINISIPDKLKEQAELLIKAGLYVSFSDFVRDSMRKALSKNKYDLLAEEAKKDLKEGRGTLLRNKKEIEDFFKTL